MFVIEASVVSSEEFLLMLNEQIIVRIDFQRIRHLATIGSQFMRDIILVELRVVLIMHLVWLNIWQDADIRACSFQRISLFTLVLEIRKMTIKVA